jgi:DNA invertase Pin-like site-specific DNA recombinase
MNNNKGLHLAESDWQQMCDNPHVFRLCSVSTVDNQDTTARVPQRRRLDVRRKPSGGCTELHRLLDQLRNGDLVRKLNRLSRSLKDLSQITEKIESADAAIVPGNITNRGSF